MRNEEADSDAAPDDVDDGEVDEEEESPEKDGRWRRWRKDWGVAHSSQAVL